MSDYHSTDIYRQSDHMFRTNDPGINSNSWNWTYGGLVYIGIRQFIIFIRQYKLHSNSSRYILCTIPEYNDKLFQQYAHSNEPHYK